MPPRNPLYTAAVAGPNHLDIDAGLTVELASTIAGARRRAQRDGDHQVDTAHLLHALLEADPEVRATFAEGGQVGRLLGYLVQRSIGYGLRWQGGIEDSGALPVLGYSEVEGWSPVAARALDAAYERAELRGGKRVRGVDLLMALLVDPRARAVEVFEGTGIDMGELVARAEFQEGWEESEGEG
ncbi:Clp domain protein [Actinobacteria bacterium OK074]|nr:Clp domain protein [Actinobacteria bacterium OK074]